jgi:hypothetical protein
MFKASGGNREDATSLEYLASDTESYIFATETLFVSLKVLLVKIMQKYTHLYNFGDVLFAASGEKIRRNW